MFENLKDPKELGKTFGHGSKEFEANFEAYINALEQGEAYTVDYWSKRIRSDFFWITGDMLDYIIDLIICRLVDDGYVLYYEGLSYVDFTYEMSDYIDFLEEFIGEALTAEAWMEFIKEEREAIERDCRLSYKQIGWIIDLLDKDGFVKKEDE